MLKKIITIISLLLVSNLGAETIEAQKITNNTQFKVSIGNVNTSAHIQFYLDIDNNPNTGYFDNNGITGADYLIEDQTLMVFQPAGGTGSDWSNWADLSTTVNLTHTTHSSEAQLALNALTGIESVIRVAVQMRDTNWDIVNNTYPINSMKTITFSTEIPNITNGFDWSLPPYANALQNKNGGMLAEDAADDIEIAGGFLEVLWYHSELEEGVFTFNHFANRLANSTGDVLVRLEVNSQCHTPSWTTIPFLNSRTLQFWKNEYLDQVSGFINKFAEDYAHNPRIVGVQLGIADGKYKTNSCPDVSALDPNNIDDNNLIFDQLVYNFGRDGWGEFWLNDAEMTEATQQGGLTASVFESKTKQIINLYVNAFGPQYKHKLALTSFDVFDGSDIGYPDIQDKMKTIAEYAIDQGIGNRGGEIEAWMRYTDNVYGVDFITGNNTDGSCSMTFNENFADTIVGRYWGDENEFYGPGLEDTSGPTSNQSYRFYMSSLRALQLRRNYFSVGSTQLNFLRNFNDEFNTNNFITYLSKVLGRTREDTPDAFVVLGERTLSTNSGLYPKEYKTPHTSEPCLIAGSNRGYTTVNEFGRWLSVVSATDGDPDLRKDMPNSEKNWGLNLIADRGNNTFYELYARKSPELLFDINDQLMQQRCPNICNLTVKIIFKDNNATSLQISHANGVSEILTTQGTGQIKTASFPITGSFSNGFNSADFSVKTLDGSELSVLMSRVNIDAVNAQPKITSPNIASNLSGSTELFTLHNGGLNITNWYLRIGSNLGNNDIANRFAAGSVTSIPVSGLPTNGSTIYVQLKYKIAGQWKNAGSYNYTAATSIPSITSPTAFTTLSGTTENFVLNNLGRTITNWYLRVGSTIGTNDIANRFASGTSESITISGLPTDGRDIYVQLKYKEDGIWRSAASNIYTASMPPILPLISSPASGSTLSGPTITFSLDNNTVPLTNWYLRIGSTIGTNDIANRFAAGSSRNIVVNNLPTNNNPIFVRLLYKEGGLWKLAKDYIYTASNN